MTRVLTTNTIHQVIEPGKAKTATEKAIPPKVKVIPAGETINVSGDWEAELRAAGAIRDFGPNEKVAVDPRTLPIMDAGEDELANRGDVKPKKPAKKPAKAADADDADDTDKSNLV